MNSNYNKVKNLKSLSLDKYGYFIIPKGTILYRSQPTISPQNIKPMKDNDTDKIGIYFASQPFLSIAINIEYKTLMDFGIFRVTSPIKIPKGGKYGYRYINPDRYFKYNEVTEKNELIPNVEIIESENISHKDCDIYPLDEYFDIFLPIEKDKEFASKENCEIFLNAKDLSNVKLEKIFYFNLHDWKELKKIIIDNNFPLDLNFYISKNILIPKNF